jgi:putative ABC transport system permease protein
MKPWWDAAYLAWRYLASAPLRTAAMALTVAVSVLLPLLTVGLGWLVEARLLDRAERTPIVVGARGDQVDLVMSALYFRGELARPTPYAAVSRLRAEVRGRVVPLHTGHSAGGIPVVGTSLEYLEARGLEVVQGRGPAVLGEVVVGAAAARAAGLGVGATLRSDQRNLYDLSGSYPVRLTVVGVLGASGSPDDEVLFADVKTTWTLDGLVHGHEQVTAADALRAGEQDLVASPAIFLFTELDAQTLPSFHAHGQEAQWPLSAVLVFPADRQAHDLTLGRLAVDPQLHAVRPVEVVRLVLGIVLRVQQLLASYLMLQAMTTAGLLALVVSLSLRLREAELTLVRRMGASRGAVWRMVGCELGMVGLLGLALGLGATAGLLLAAARWAP